MNKFTGIRNESTDHGDLYQLYVDGSPQACVTKKAKSDLVELRWEIAGPQYWPKAKRVLQGLLDLSIIADQLSGDSHGQED
jgi:hypothetical protein